MKTFIATKKETMRSTAKEARIIGDKLGIDWDEFDVEEFRLGLEFERAAGIYNPVTNIASDDPILVGKIVRAHLTKCRDYYTYWAAREKEEKRRLSSKH